MADVSGEKHTASVKPVETEEKDVEGAAAAKEDSQNDSDVEEDSDEEIVLDEPSDTENYEPKEKMGEEGSKIEDEDESCSSGEEEEGVNVDIVEFGGQKFFKLKFDDVEAKRKEHENKMKDEEEDDEEEDEKNEESKEEEKDEGSEDKENKKPLLSFKEYRTATVMDEDMEKDYDSADDDNFDPVYCGETLSDVEYSENDERDTESEPETEPMEGTHKRTGESLVCIKMIEQLNIPPRDHPCSPSEFPNVKSSDQPMECS